MANIVTAEEVYDLAGVTVAFDTISRAQLSISTEAGVALHDPAAYAALSAADQRHLVTAVVWQTVYLDRHPASFGGGEFAANVVAASTNGSSVTLSGPGGGDVSGLARRELELLSWRAGRVGIRTLRPYSRAAQRGPQPDPWVTVS